MRETVCLLLGFALLAFGSRLLYRFYLKICVRLSKADSALPQDCGPLALVLAGVSLFTIFLLLVMAYMGAFLDLPPSTGSVLLAGALLLAFDDLLIFAGWQYGRRKEQANLTDQLALQKRQTEVGYYRALEEQYDRQRVLIHDIRKHLETLRDLAEEGLEEEVARYVRELEASPALQNKVRICGNRILDVILRRYGEICQEKGIAFLVDVRDKSVDFLEPGDMTALFGNLLENAVEASAGARDAYLELMVDARPGSLLVVTLVNSCREAPKSDGRGGFLTRKAPGAGHGTGMKSIRDTVEKYGGTMRQYYEEEGKLFHTVILLK